MRARQVKSPSRDIGDFLDSRPEEAFRKTHVAEALSLPNANDVGRALKYLVDVGRARRNAPGVFQSVKGSTVAEAPQDSSTRHTGTTQVIRELASSLRGAPFHVNDAHKMLTNRGITPRRDSVTAILYNMAKAGELERLSRSMYRASSAAAARGVGAPGQVALMLHRETAGHVTVFLESEAIGVVPRQALVSVVRFREYIERAVVAAMPELTAALMLAYRRVTTAQTEAAAQLADEAKGED